MVDNGASFRAVTSRRMSALHLAAEGGDVDLVRVLLLAGVGFVEFVWMVVGAAMLIESFRCNRTMPFPLEGGGFLFVVRGWRANFAKYFMFPSDLYCP